MAPKVVTHHANLDNPKRCFMRLFQRYRELCPKDAPPHAFYLQPSRNPTSTCWYSKCPLGHTTLGKTVARLCKLAGIEGYKTNHFLRATATSRLYQSGVDEQLVMERTGHWSLEGVCSYKWTSDAQCEVLSDILNGGTKKAKLDDTRTSESHLASTVPALLADTPTFLSASQHSQQLRTLNLPSATFNQCTGNCSCSDSLSVRNLLSSLSPLIVTVSLLFPEHRQALFTSLGNWESVLDSRLAPDRP